MQLRIAPKTWTQIEEQNDAGAAGILRICILLPLSFLNIWVSTSPTLMFLYFKQLPKYSSTSASSFKLKMVVSNIEDS
jgi:hypothetical protein